MLPIRLRSNQYFCDFVNPVVAAEKCGLRHELYLALTRAQQDEQLESNGIKVGINDTQTYYVIKQGGVEYNA